MSMKIKYSTQDTKMRKRGIERPSVSLKVSSIPIKSDNGIVDVDKSTPSVNTELSLQYNRNTNEKTK